MIDTDQAREQLRLIIREFSDGPMGRGGDPSWTTLCETYEALLAEVKQLRELLDAIYWDAFAEDDTTLEIDREVAERIRRGD